MWTLLVPARAQENQSQTPEPVEKPLRIEVAPGSKTGVDISLKGDDVSGDVSVTVNGGINCTIQSSGDQVTLSDCAPAPETMLAEAGADTTETFTEDEASTDNYRGGEIRLGVFSIKNLG
jgi:hypothetical protein